MSSTMVSDQSKDKTLIKGRIGKFAPLIRQSISAHGLVIIVTLLSLAGYFFLVPVTPDQNPLNGLLIITIVFIATVIALLVGVLFHVLFDVVYYQRPKSPIMAIWRAFQKYFSDTRRLILGAPLVVIMSIFMASFTKIKSHIPIANPFSWDETFYQWDKVVHFGYTPWEFVHSFFSANPILISILNINYNLWFFTMWLVLVPYVLSVNNSVLRTRFLLTFFLVWSIGGSLMAVFFSSAGPAFYEGLGLSPNPYAELMAFLHQQSQTYSLWAIDLQDKIWSDYTTKGLNIGISAMPSLHNATALLFVMGAWHLSRKASYFMMVHAFLIYVGSFYLGWHYAIDAYIGWSVTIACWYVSAPIATWWHKRPAIIAFSEQMERK